MPPRTHALTVDVEEAFQVEAFSQQIDPSQWERYPSRVQANTERVLELLARHGVQATFFVLGWVAERQPQLVRRIVDAGHELASHGYSHTRVDRQSPERFLAEAIASRDLLEQIGGVAVQGYRAASFSINRSTLWALPLLKQAGYRYSSSIAPVVHDLYGMADAPRFPHYPMTDGVLEIPLPTVLIPGWRLQCGGGFFRLYPYWLSRWFFRQLGKEQAGFFYCHPWEFDSEQPQVPGASFKSRFRHTVGLRHMAPRLEQLLTDFAWDRLDRVHAALIAREQPHDR